MNNLPGSDPLAALRPLHPPPAIDWWPPAPGWWVLVIVLAVLGGLAWRRWRRTALRRVALDELRQLEREVQDDARLAAGISRLLRRIALACFPRRQVAALTGEAWLRFLDEQAGGRGFCSGPGRVLLTAPYTPHCTLDRTALLALARDWIRRQPRGRS